jgi:hypothetical protein
MRLARISIVVVLASALVAAAAWAATPDAKQAPGPSPAPAAGAAAGSPNTKTVNAPRYTPLKPQGLSAQHKILEGYVGKWKTTIHIMPEDSSAEPSDSQGTAEGKLLMGGRFIEMTHTSVVGGQPYEGTWLCGYDDVVSRYMSTWIDNTSPAILSYVGAYDSAKKQMTMTTHYSDPQNRKLVMSRVTLTTVDANTVVFDQYIAHAVGGKEAHTMSITYKRS